jgi:VanZ family protein
MAPAVLDASGVWPIARRMIPKSYSPVVRVLFWLATTFAVVMAVLPKPPASPLDRFGDKVEHIVAFAILALLANLGFRAVDRRLIVERLSFLGAAIEVVQSIPALHRDCDVRDWLVDTAAVVAVTLIAGALARRSPSRTRG